MILKATEQFRQNEAKSAHLANLFRSDPILAEALAICDASGPNSEATTFNQAIFEEPHVGHIQLGIDRGYALYSRTFRSLALPLEKQEPVEPTYDAPKDVEEAMK